MLVAWRLHMPLAISFYSEFGQLPIIGNFYVFPTDYLTERDHALWVLAVATMIAGVAWSWLAKWLHDALLAANKQPVFKAPPISTGHQMRSFINGYG